LDWAEDDLEELEISSGNRSTGNSDFMAAQTIQAILVLISGLEDDEEDMAGRQGFPPPPEDNSKNEKK
jgi:hypothetical protein